MRTAALALALALCACGSATAATGRAGGEPLVGQEWWLSHIGADKATPPGPGVPMTIVDSGVDATHPEFAGRPNTTYLNTQTVLGGEESHGTSVASVAAAPENGVGLLGVYPQIVLQSWDATPRGRVLTAVAAQGVRAAALHCPGVISISFGNQQPDSDLEDAILTAVHQGCLVVAAAGNDGTRGSPPTYPADFPHVLTVGAAEQDDSVAAFSSRSPFMDIAAPGDNMLLAVPTWKNPTGYEPDGGTSFAAPTVAAAAAWIWTVRPDLDGSQIYELMRRSARDIAAPGFDTESGYGILDIPTALTAPAPARDPAEPNDDIGQVAPNRLFALGTPAVTSATKPSSRIAGRIDENDDPRDLYRIWVPANKVVRVGVGSNPDVKARIWGPVTTSVTESAVARHRDFKGTTIRGPKKGFTAYAEVLATGHSRTADYVLSITASRR